MPLLAPWRHLDLHIEGCLSWRPDASKVSFWVIFFLREDLGHLWHPTLVCFFEEKLILKLIFGASLVAQWLRICLLMQGTRVRALVWEDPTCHGAAGPVSHNY